MGNIGIGRQVTLLDGKKEKKNLKGKEEGIPTSRIFQSISVL